LTLTLLAVAVWGGGRPAEAAPGRVSQASPCGVAPGAGNFDRTVAGGRTYTVHVPPGLAAGARVRLVVSLHGYSWPGLQPQPATHINDSGLNTFADRYATIVAYPRGIYEPVGPLGLGVPFDNWLGWDYLSSTSADVTFLRNVVADAKAR
jgi:poly(3-hydroxybutyrate) depolymerase